MSDYAADVAAAIARFGMSLEAEARVATAIRNAETRGYKRAIEDALVKMEALPTNLPYMPKTVRSMACDAIRALAQPEPAQREDGR